MWGNTSRFPWQEMLDFDQAIQQIIQEGVHMEDRTGVGNSEFLLVFSRLRVAGSPVCASQFVL